MLNGGFMEQLLDIEEMTKGEKYSRRQFLTLLGALGIVGSVIGHAGPALSGQKVLITEEMMIGAEKIAGLEFTEDERQRVIKRLSRNMKAYEAVRNLHMPNRTPLSLYFNPIPPGKTIEKNETVFNPSTASVKKPDKIEDAAFFSINQLAELIRTKQISSMELTRMYIARLKKHDPGLNCVVNLTEELALKQARRADQEIKSGKYKGPLHGIPWGVKDIFATRDYPTTWGAEPYKDRVLDFEATVVRRLEEAGAVLVAKLALGELATGDKWYGGRTRNPWKPSQGSGGSSAGSACAVAAGLVGFSIGTETNESLVGPAMVCGVSGLRPTFGRVSRYGVMTVSWSYDKIGPMCRGAEDCALVFNAIYGPDNLDRSVLDMPFSWDADIKPSNIRIGYIKQILNLKPENKFAAAVLKAHRDAFKKLDALGFKMVEIKDVPFDYLDKLIKSSSFGLLVEAAAAHDELTLSNQDEMLKHSNWEDRFIGARYVPAVEYIQANRARTLLIEEIDRIFDGVDVVLGRIVLSAIQSNITGHPELVIPHGLNSAGTPNSIILTGKLFGETELLSVAHKYQAATNYHELHPPLE